MTLMAEKSSEQVRLDENVPHRVQCTGGFYHFRENLGPNDFYVGRPSKFGNPYKLSQYPLLTCLALYRLWLRKQLDANPHFLDELRGKNLACWCKLDAKCHADILLELANR